MFVRITWKTRPAGTVPPNWRRPPPFLDRGCDLGPVGDFHKMTKSLFDRPE